MSRHPPATPTAPNRADATAGADGPRRFDRLDALRGAAVVWMAVFHFCFDLNHFGFISQDFRGDLVWTLQRTAIVSMFLFCAGLGQAVAWQQGLTWPRFWRRWRQVAACALLVSAGSALMFPRSFIFFGVLHGLAVMLILTRLVAHGVTRDRWVWLAAALAVSAPWWLAHPAFDARSWAWVGLVTRKPVTEDFVPVLPWVGVMWAGLASGRWLLRHHPSGLSGPLPSAWRPLAALGRWSLSFYMVHQPVLIGALMAVAALRLGR